MTPSLPRQLADAAALRPDAVAVQVVDGPSLTYLEWQERSTVQACGLHDAGLSSGGRLAMLFDNEGWADFAIAYMAAVKAGVVPVPLSARLSALEIGRVMRACGASALVAPGAHAPAESGVRCLDPEELTHRGAAHRPGLPAAGAMPEILVRSRPLAVPVLLTRSPETMLAGSAVARSAAGADGVLLHCWPVGSVPGQDALCAALQPSGPRVLVLPAFDPVTFWAALSSGGATACSIHPAVAEALLQLRRCWSFAPELRGLVLASGRVAPPLRRALAEAVPEARLFVAAEDDGPAERRPSGHRLHLPPRGASVAVAAAWRRVLHREVASADDDFFEHGGDGVRASRLLRLVDDAVGVRVDITAFLRQPTLGALVALVSRELTGDTNVAASAAGTAPAAFSQEGMLWHECFAPGCQNLPGLARRFRGPLHVGALARALTEIVRRHEPLRSTFAVDEGRLWQVVHPAGGVGLNRCDVSALPLTEREEEVERLVSDAGSAPFDLVDGPLFEPTLVRVADDDHVLVIRTHHSVFDDWSVGVFRRQLAALYETYASAGGPAPPESRVTFATFAREQRRSLAGDAGADAMRYWRDHLHGAPLTTQLAVQDPRAPVGSAQPVGGPIMLTFPDAVRNAVRSLARHERATVFTVLLAAFAALASRRTGQDDLLLSTVVANRNRTDLEHLIGCFTKKVPLRLDLRSDPAFTEIVARTRRALLGALQHQDLPFEAVLQEVLGPRAELYGLVPTDVVMVQGVTPRQDLPVLDVESVGFETSNRAARAHFMSASPQRAPRTPWGCGLYLGTFVILSIAYSEDELTCTARGAFDGPSITALMDDFGTVVADAVAAPTRRLSELAAAPDLRPAPAGTVDLAGFHVDTVRIAAALSSCPAVRSARVRVRDAGGAPQLVAEITPVADAPDDDTLRTHLWATLPGYAWPARVTTAAFDNGGNAALIPEPADAQNAAPAPRSAPDAALLGALWAEVLGIDRCRPEDNYWQDFSFLEALARARDAGVLVPTELVTRNRTLRALATAMAARRGSDVAGAST